MAGTQNQPLEYEQVTYNAPDGAQMGRATTDKIAFYGSTPIVQQTIGAASTYNITSNTTSTVGFISVAELSSFIAQVSSITNVLKNLGLSA